MASKGNHPDTRLRPVPRLLLFDLDDTLCDYAGARAGRLRIAFGSALDCKPDLDLDRLIADSLSIHPHGTDHFPELLARYGIADPSVAEAAATWYRTNRFHGLAFFADAVATLGALRSSDPTRRIGVVTNGPADVQRAKVELLGIERLADFVLISGEFGVWKPDPAIFHEALRLGGASVAEAVFIGDSAEHDIAGAQAVGLRTIWINRTGVPWTWSALPPDVEVTSLTALLPLLG
jgi:HAD superfamily hydrolase (TIGR01509 family)